MNSLVSDALAKQVRFDEDTMWVDLADGRTLGLPQSVAVSIISPHCSLSFIILAAVRHGSEGAKR